jgi:hypothetical protein
MDAGWMVDVVPGRWMVDDDAGMDARMDAGRWMFNAGYWMMDGWMVDARMDAWMPGCSMYARMDTWMLDGGCADARMLDAGMDAWMLDGGYPNDDAGS